jgi:hypothetical protein
VTPQAQAERLRRATAERLQTVLADAEREGGHIPAERLAALRDLAAVLELPARLQPAAPRPRWPLAAALAATLATASVLLFWRVSSTPIELDAVASELSFRLTSAQPLTQVAPLRALRIAGLASIEPADGLAAVTAGHSPPAGMLSLHAQADDPKCSGSLTLDRMLLPAGAQVTLRRTPATQAAPAARVQMALLAPGTVLRLTADGCVRVGAASGAVWSANGARALAVHLAADEADLELDTPPEHPLAFAPWLRADAISLTRIERIAADDRMLVRQISTLVAGTLVYTALDGRERKLRVAEPLRFGRAQGEFRSIEAVPGGVAASFRGEVAGMASGSADAPRSLMPTWLDWIAANHGVSLLWGSALYGFGLIMALLKWWRREG